MLNGREEGGLPHTLNLSFEGCPADSLLMLLDLAGVACSTGSACSSGSLLPSPVLKAMGRTVVRCGGAGAGQAAKVCNNMILAATMIATCEGFVLAEKLGLSHQALFDVASKSSGQSWSLTSYCPVPGPVPNSTFTRSP